MSEASLPPLAASAELGSLGVPHLKRIWSSAMSIRQGDGNERADEELQDRLVTDALGVGRHQLIAYLFQFAPTFQEFEDWIVATGGEPSALTVARLRQDLLGESPDPDVLRWRERVEEVPPVLSADELESWEREGFVVLRRAVEAKPCAEALHAIYEFIGADPDVPDTWYQRSDPRIMVELIQHPALEANRRAYRIQKAFAQLWGTTDLWTTADRCGFHPPQRKDCPFPGPDLHWDADLSRPVPCATQGILYLSDTPAEQGALTLVPGFQHRLDEWLEALAPGLAPQQQDLHALGSVPVAGAAGDMVIWNQRLPHGSRPNLGTRPRIVQYINLYPGRAVSS